jgi:hypothetical protein
MITLEEYKTGLKGWEHTKHQAEIDLELTNMIIPQLEKKIKELEAQEVKNGE